jgi:hypothetical protein
MKLAFVVHSERCSTRVMELLESAKIDYYTRWKQSHGAGHATQAHLGTARALGGFGVTNCVLMIAFEDEAPLAALIEAITAANTEIARADDRIRMFVLPLAQIV